MIKSRRRPLLLFIFLHVWRPEWMWTGPETGGHKGQRRSCKNIYIYWPFHGLFHLMTPGSEASFAHLLCSKQINFSLKDLLGFRLKVDSLLVNLSGQFEMSCSRLNLRALLTHWEILCPVPSVIIWYTTSEKFGHTKFFFLLIFPDWRYPRYKQGVCNYAAKTLLNPTLLEIKFFSLS